MRGEWPCRSVEDVGVLVFRRAVSSLGTRKTEMKETAAL